LRYDAVMEKPEMTKEQAREKLAKACRIWNETIAPGRANDLISLASVRSRWGRAYSAPTRLAPESLVAIENQEEELIGKLRQQEEKWMEQHNVEVRQDQWLKTFSPFVVLDGDIVCVESLVLNHWAVSKVKSDTSTKKETQKEFDVIISNLLN